MRARSPAAALALAVLCACRSRPPGGAAAGADAAPPPAHVEAVSRGAFAGEGPAAATWVARDESPAAEVSLAPASGAPREEREGLVAALLAGKLASSDVVTVATDPQRTFDEALRGKLTSPGPSRPEKFGVRDLQADGLDVAQVRRVLDPARGSIRQCYRKGLEVVPRLRGLVPVRLVVGSRGDVTSATSEGDTLPEGAVVECILRRHRSLTFPKPTAASARISMVYVLAPE